MINYVFMVVFFNYFFYFQLQNPFSYFDHLYLAKKLRKKEKVNKIINNILK